MSLAAKAKHFNYQIKFDECTLTRLSAHGLVIHPSILRTKMKSIRHTLVPNSETLTNRIDSLVFIRWTDPCSNQKKENILNTNTGRYLHLNSGRQFPGVNPNASYKENWEPRSNAPLQAVPLCYTSIFDLFQNNEKSNWLGIRKAAASTRWFKKRKFHTYDGFLLGPTLRFG